MGRNGLMGRVEYALAKYGVLCKKSNGQRLGLIQVSSLGFRTLESLPGLIYRAMIPIGK